VHLNKRVGHFALLALNYLGSVNLADTANTYNIVPDAVRPGDTLLERWQRVGIGHTLVVKDVAVVGEGNLDGEPYARLGGGIKRWRVTKDVGGFWTNTWMSGDEAHWIDSRDLGRIAARPARFDQILGEVPPDQLRDALVALIDDARSHLSSFPASCAARERRERAFDDLYDLMGREFGLSAAEVDRRFRKLDDYVFAELEYNRARTCCWNSTTSAMYRVIMDAAAAEQAAAEAEGSCRAPTVFRHHADGYARWATFAARHGRSGIWRAWNDDEPCPQAALRIDEERDHAATAYCELGASQETACSDAAEPNASAASAATLPPGAHDLRICTGDHDFIAVPAGGPVRIGFRHADGDLDLAALAALAAVDAAGHRVATSAGAGDREEVVVPAGGSVEIFGFNGAAGAYRLVLP
jgi:hypothetical protein